MTLYLKHFGLREAPFKITPTTEFFYAGGRRGEILHALQYAITSGEGIMMISGEVGSGKTMLLRTLIEKLPGDTEIVYIPNPSLSGNEILYHICEELNLEIDVTRSDTVRRLQNYLIEKHAAGHRVIAFIDEAQAMPDESLEEIRLLSNLETSRNKLLQIVLFGQPELDDKLRRQNMRQLRERITVALNLQPFTYRDVREYISTRLSAAGYNGPPLFSDDAGKLIAAISQGLSRRINVLADKSMLSAFERNGLSINYGDAKRAAKDVKFGKMRYRSENSKYLSRRLSIGIAATSCFILVLVLGLRWIDKDEPIAVADTLSVEAAKELSTLVTTAEESEEATIQETTALAVAEESEEATIQETTALAVAEESEEATIQETTALAVAEESEEATIQETTALAVAEESEDATIQETTALAVAEESEDATIQETTALAVAEESEDAAIQETTALAVALEEAEETREVEVDDEKDANTDTQALNALQEDLAAALAVDEATNNGGKEQQTKMRAVIDSMQYGDKKLSGEELAVLVGEIAESHQDEEEEITDKQWAATTRTAKDLIDNPQWHWMPKSSYLRGRLNVTQTWLTKESKSSSYTARLLTVSQNRGVFLERFLRHFADFYPLRNVMVYPMRLKSGDKFVLTFGVYATRADAEVFLTNVPSYFVGGRPFAQPISASIAEAAIW